MSLDIYLQRFESGDAADADAAIVGACLAPFLIAEEGERRRGNLRFSDGDAEIYGTDDLTTGFMVTHASGRAVWDLLVAVAARAGLTIMPVGCPTAVTTRDALVHLPPELAANAVVVETGAELLESILSS